jgi:lipase
MATRPFDQHMITCADGTVIATAVWSGAGEPLMCVHGLTSSSMAFAGLATELSGRTLVAVDCRGRGQSSKEGPFGLDRHVADLAAVMDALGIDRATVAGHSMGAYVAAAFCAAVPDRVSRLVFVDGGHFLDYPKSLTPEMLLEVMLGPFLEKLRRTWTSLDDYIAYYESTALYPDGVDDYGRVHFAYDLTGDPPQLVCRITEACLVPDWTDVLDHPGVCRRLESVKVPLLLLRAPDGLTGNGDMVVPDQVRDQITALVADAAVVDVPGTNHHTILFSRAGARAVAAAVAGFLG